MEVSFKGMCEFFHIENFENASEEEVIFLRHLEFRLQASIHHLADEANGKADRIARAVALALIQHCENVHWGTEASISPPDFETWDSTIPFLRTVILGESPWRRVESLP